jgi:hypothetical protein
MGDRGGDVCSDLSTQLTAFCKKKKKKTLSLVIKHGAFTLIHKANDEVCKGKC